MSSGISSGISSSERDGITSFDPGDAHGGMYHLMNAVIAPRPIAWVSSVSAGGTLNIAPHSYTTVLSPNPPVVGFVSIGRKDTWRNVEANREFVYHIAGQNLAEQLNRSAADFPADVSEFEWAGLTPVASDLVSVPRVREAPVAFEAKLVDIVRILDTENALIMGQIIRVHISDAIVQDRRIDPIRLDPLGRLAGSGFSRLGDLFSMERPTYRGLIDSGARPLPATDRDS